MERTDAQLVSEAVLGKQGSFETLVHRYTVPLYNFAHRLTGNVQTAEDITQETFIKVWKNLKKYDPKQVFRAWIFTIARNTVTDHLRKKKAIPFSNLSQDNEFNFEENIPDEAELPDTVLEHVQDAKLLEEFLDQLPPDYKTVMILHYQEHMTFDEIGIIVKKPLNTVKSWHRRALLKLKSMIQ